MDKIIQRILEQLGDIDLPQKLTSLSKSDFNSLMLEVYKMQSKELTPADVLKKYRTNRFAAPSDASPSSFHKLEAELLSAAENNAINTILLSPAAPFSSSSVFDCVDQNNVVSAVRGNEILSDPTNMLAIIIADRLKNRIIENKTPVHYCTTARVVRAQLFSGKRNFSHFGLFCIVSSGRDSGSYACEKDLLIKQLSFYKSLFCRKYNAEIELVLSKRGGYAAGSSFFERVSELIKAEMPCIPISLDFDHIDNNYYLGLSFKFFIKRDKERIELGDGGFVDWIQKMTDNKKERCLISGIGLDRLLTINNN